MEKRPTATGTTGLSGDELVLLDALFAGPARRSSLDPEAIEREHRIPYRHGLEGSAIDETLRRLGRAGLVRGDAPGPDGRWELTEPGGRAWEDERRPDWGKFCAVGRASGELGEEHLSVRSPSAESCW